MKKPVTPYKSSQSSKKEQVTTMFNGISKQYDVLNRVISLGIDQSWRRKVVRMASENQPQRILDVATGTGDLAIALKATGANEIIGLDISPGMLEIGTEKVKALALDHQINMVWETVKNYLMKTTILMSSLLHLESVILKNSTKGE